MFTLCKLKTQAKFIAPLYSKPNQDRKKYPLWKIVHCPQFRKLISLLMTARVLDF